MIGQETSVTFDFNTASAGIYSTSSGITLSPGVWLLDLSAVVSGASGLTAALGAISTDSGATSFSDPSFTTPNFFTGAANGTVFDPGVKVSFYLNTASSPTYYAKIYVTGANARARGRLRAVRIA